MKLLKDAVWAADTRYLHTQYFVQWEHGNSLSANSWCELTLILPLACCRNMWYSPCGHDLLEVWYKSTNTGEKPSELALLLMYPGRRLHNGTIIQNVTEFTCLKIFWRQSLVMNCRNLLALRLRLLGGVRLRYIWGVWLIAYWRFCIRKDKFMVCNMEVLYNVYFRNYAI
jgi:hypothetical protein